MRRLRSVALDQVTHNYYLSHITGDAWMRYVYGLWMPLRDETGSQSMDHISFEIQSLRKR